MTEDDFQLDLEALSRSCRCTTELMVTLVQEGALEPQGSAPADWSFGPQALRRARRAVRLAHDLDINAPGVALALDLLDQIERLEAALSARR